MYVEYIHTTSDRMLCSKDLVKRAIEFREPERVPYNFDSNRTPVTAERYGDDRYRNEFGVVYHRPARRYGRNRPQQFVF